MDPELRKKLEKFKSWIETPRLYIVEELGAIKNEIDIFAERFLMRASKSKENSKAQIEKAHEKINSNRRQMIDEVDAFQKKILTKMPTNELDAELSKKSAKSVEELEKKLTLLLNNKDNTQNEWSELEYAIDCAIYEFEIAIKQKSSVMFINVFLLKKSLNSHTKFDDYDNEIGRRQEKKFGIKLPESEMERDEDEVAFDYPDLYFKLESSTTFGVLFLLDDCVSKEEFV